MSDSERELLSEALRDRAAMSEYARALEGELMPQLRQECEPPVSDTEFFEHDSEDLGELRRELAEAEARAEAARYRAWTLRVRIQDAELTERWRARRRRPWTPPRLVASERAGADVVSEEISGPGFAEVETKVSPKNLLDRPSESPPPAPRLPQRDVDERKRKPARPTPPARSK